MKPIELWLRCDIKQGSVSTQFAAGTLFSQDNMANLIGVKMYEDGAEMSLSGGCAGKVMRADGATVTVSGTVSGNKAYIVLPQACYAVPGEITVSVLYTEGSGAMTVGQVRGSVTRSVTGTIVDPGSVVPDVSQIVALYEQMSTATTNATTAAATANTAANNAYAKAAAANSAAAKAGNLAITTQYYLSTSDQTPTGGSWSSAPPAYAAGKYYWARDIVTYGDSTTSTGEAYLCQALNDTYAAAAAANTAAANGIRHDTVQTLTDAQKAQALSNIGKYNDICQIIKITSTGTTLGNIAATLNQVNTAGDHVFFDLSALGVMMYLCTIFIDTSNNVYKVFDLVSGRYAEGAYDAAMLLTMATAQANGLAVQSQINYLQNEIDALGGKSVLANWDALGDKIADGTSTDLITPGDSIEINWIKTVLGTTTSGLTVACSDIQAFADEMGEAEAKDYLFVYNGTAWTYNGEVVDLADYALTVTGTPATGEVMDIKTTVTGDLYTFTGYDDVEAADPNVPHNWLLEKTYAPSTKAFDAYESLFCIQAGKSIAAGKYYLPLYSWRSGKTFNACFELSAALGNESSKVQLARAASGSAETVDATGATVAGAFRVTSLSPVLFGTATSAGSAVAVTYMSTADAEAGGYTLLSSLNADAADPVYTAGDFDQAALGDNCWPNGNLCQHLNSEAQNGGYTPSHDNDIASAYNRQAGFLYGMDPRVKKLIQYAAVKWTAGRGNPNTPHYTPATGTAPAADAPTYYQRGGAPGARTYTALDPQPAAGDDVSAYYIHEDAYVYNKTYTAEQRVFLLSFKEMGFATVNTGEGNITDLYKEYCGGAATDSAVAARAKYNKAGGALNNYRWARSAVASNASGVRFITPSGSNGNNAYNAFYYAPAFIVGKSINPA